MADRRRVAYKAQDAKETYKRQKRPIKDKRDPVKETYER